VDVGVPVVLENVGEGVSCTVGGEIVSVAVALQVRRDMDWVGDRLAVVRVGVSEPRVNVLVQLRESEAVHV